MEEAYHLENRLFTGLFHWFFLILAGLRHLEKINEKVNIYLPWLEDRGFHNDSLKYFENKFNIFKEIDLNKFNIKYHHGERLVCMYKVADEAYNYIREKFLENTNYSVIPKKYVYITRKLSELLPHNYGNKHHQIINENELVDMLKRYNFEIINLELLDLKGKIKLFCEAEIILAPFGGGLTFTVFCNEKQTVIEMISPNERTDTLHYKTICNLYNVGYHRFTDVKYSDSQFNIDINVNSLEYLIKQAT